MGRNGEHLEIGEDMTSTGARASGLKVEYLKQLQWCAGRCKIVMKLIPGTDCFYATPDGRVFDRYFKEKVYYKNGDGYVTCNVSVNGRYVTMGVHRLIALTYVENDKPEERIHVNHIDCVKNNNESANLEWVTPQENNIHAAIVKGSPRKYLIKVRKFDDIRYFKNKEDAMRLLECDFLTLWQSIKEDRLVNGYSVEFKTDAIPYSMRNLNKTDLFKRVGVTILDIHNKKSRSFKSMKEASDFLWL